MATLIARSFGYASGLGVAALLLGCGDALVDRQFQGDPLITVRGNVMGSSDALPLENPLLRLSVWWSPLGLTLSDYSQLVEQPSITTQSSVPFSFTLNVFDTPAQAHFTQLPDGTRYAVGSLMGYYDSNGLAAVERVQDHVPVPGDFLPRQRLWSIRAQRVVLATGAYLRFMAR